MRRDKRWGVDEISPEAPSIICNLVTSAGAKIAFASLIAMIVNVLYSEMLEIELFLDLLTG